MGKATANELAHPASRSGNQRPAPLVAYWFGPDNDDFRTFVRNPRSGGVARNDFAVQMIPSAAPFGGVGRSGMGSGGNVALRVARLRTHRRLRRRGANSA
jgi:acyl-CoA reductase-like NAD-dependent aldehyde dehydrogenase